MYRNRGLISALGMLALLGGCRPAAETVEQAEARMNSETAAARTAIEAANARFTSMVNAEQYDSAAGVYAESGRALPPNMPVDVGRAAIVKSLSGLAGMKTSMSFTITSLDVNGPLAVESGTYRITVTPPGAPAAVTDTGKYMAHWRKVGDQWVVVENIWNSDLPAMPVGKPAQ